MSSRMLIILLLLLPFYCSFYCSFYCHSTAHSTAHCTAHSSAHSTDCWRLGSRSIFYHLQNRGSAWTEGEPFLLASDHKTPFRPSGSRPLEWKRHTVAPSVPASTPFNGWHQLTCRFIYIFTPILACITHHYVYFPKKKTKKLTAPSTAHSTACSFYCSFSCLYIKSSRMSSTM